MAMHKGPSRTPSGRRVPITFCVPTKRISAQFLSQKPPRLSTRRSTAPAATGLCLLRGSYLASRGSPNSSHLLWLRAGHVCLSSNS